MGLKYTVQPMLPADKPYEITTTQQASFMWSNLGAGFCECPECTDASESNRSGTKA